MRRVLAGVLVVSALVLAAPARAAAKQPVVDHVLIVATPRLTWRAVADNRPPNLMKLLNRSAVASMSLRTVGPRTTPGRGYATIGAGNRATVVDLTAGMAFNTDERIEGASAGVVFQRRSGAGATGRIVELGLAESQRRNRRLLYGTQIGLLGSELARHGLTTAVVANADADPDTTLVQDHGWHREAALAVMDRAGSVAGGTVDPNVLLAPDTSAPYSRRLDANRVQAAFVDAWAKNDVVLVELSDLERADAYGDVATADARHLNKVAALQRSDALLGGVLATIDPARTLVLVVTPAAPRTLEQLGVAAVAGPGVKPGLARSPTTRRAGYVTLPDVAPTVLDAFGHSAPHKMAGTAMTSVGGSSPTLTTAKNLARDNDRTVFRDKATGPVSVLFVVFQVLVYGAAAAVLVWTRSRRARAAVAYCSLVVLAVPLLGFLSGLVPYDGLGIGGYLAVLFGAAAALAAGAWALGRRRALLAPGVLVGATLALLVVDVVMGAPLQLDTVFGYSPVVAGRFAGYGNLAYGLLAMSTLVTATIAWALLGRTRRATWVVAAILVAAIVVDGAPQWGSDVGGVLASGPAFIVTAALLAGRRIDWRRIAVAVAATIAALGVFALVDLSRPASSRTHLGRLVADPGELGDVVQRKLLSNLHILTSSVWTLIIPVALAFLILLAVRPPGLLNAIQRETPGLRACLVGGLLAGILGFAVNDSGVAVPAIMLAVLLPYLTYLLARTALDP